MEKSRTHNVSLNVVVALACQVLNLLINFISRTVFIATLDVEYLGVNGLFTNVLTILSFAELGIGNAIVFSMYKPLAEHDHPRLASLMALYKKAYRTIALVVLCAGVSVTPFLGAIIKDKPDIPENLTVLYWLFLLNTVLSYCAAYKKSIIIADQKNYIVLAVTEVIHVVQLVAQIACLYLLKSYILFLVLQIAGTFGSNIVASIVADRMYPYLKGSANPLKKDETRQIFQNVRAMAAYKFGSVILNGTANILVSALVGVVEVGLVSNYVLLTNACSGILGKITDAFTASVGNLNTNADAKKKYDVFNKIFFITIWLYGFAAVGLITVFKSFVTAWIGPDFVIAPMVSIAIVLGFFVQGVHATACTYRVTLGYFVKGKFAPILSAILNIILSFVLFRFWGTAGIFLATPIARLLVIGTVDIAMIYKDAFKVSPIYYYLRYAGFLIVFVGVTLLCQLCLGFISISGWLGVAVEVVIVTVLYNLVMLLLFGRTQMFKELLQSFTTLLHRR